MLQNTDLVYESLYVVDSTRARCVLAGNGRDWPRGEVCIRLVKGSTRPGLHGERVRCVPQFPAKSSVLKSEA